MLLSIVSAIVLFWYGLEAFGQQIQAASGEALRRWLSRLTEKRWLGLLTGAAAVSIVQSSGAVTSLAAALVDAGAMSFRSSLGVLLGANIGTTSTGFLVSLNLTSIGSFFIVLGALLSAFPTRFKLVGKAVDMEVGGRQHREVWPARLFVLDEEKLPEAKARQRLTDALRGQLTTAEARRKEIEAGFNQPIQDPEQAVRMKRELVEAILQEREIQTKLAELERSAGQTGDARLEGMKARLTQQRAVVDSVLAEVTEMQTKLAAVRAQPNVPPEVLKKLF